MCAWGKESGDIREVLLASTRNALYNRSMRAYERYILSHLIWPAVIITGSLTGIVWLTQMLRFLDFILNRGLTFFDFLTLTGLMLPSLLLVLTPVSLAIAGIYTYHRLASDSELIVLGAVGLSKWQVARPLVWLGTVAMACCILLSFYVMPMANQRFRDIRTLFRDKYASVLLEEGVFNSPMDSVTVFVRERDAGNNLSGILLHDARDPQQTITMLAARGRVEQTSSGPKFYLQEGLRQQLRDGRLSWLSFDNYAIEIAFYGQQENRRRSAEERTILDLFRQEGLTDKERRAYYAEAHQRLSWPLLCITLPLLGVATLFSAEFNRRGQGKRLAVAGILIAACVLLYFAFRNLSVRHAVFVVGMHLIAWGGMFAGAHVLVRGRVIYGIRLPKVRFSVRKAGV